MKKMSKDDFFGKMDWEGGYTGLASYGLDPKEIKDKKLSELWAKYRAKYDEADAIADEIEKLR